MSVVATVPTRVELALFSAIVKVPVTSVGASLAPWIVTVILCRTGRTSRVAHRVGKNIAERITARSQSLHSGIAVVDRVGIRNHQPRC